MGLVCKLAPEFVEIPSLPTVKVDEIDTPDYRAIALTLDQPVEFVRTMTPTQLHGRWTGHFLREWSLGLMSQVMAEEDKASRRANRSRVA